MITYAIIGVTCLVSFLCFSNEESFNRLAHIPTRIDRNGEYYRLLTSGFVHANPPHLFLNMFVLFNFGPLLEEIFKTERMFGEFGSTSYLLFYLSAIVAANAPTYVKNRDNFSYIGIGASGAIAALLFACIVFIPMLPLRVFFMIPIKAWLFGVLYLLYETYADKNVSDGVAHDVHLSGAFYGILFIAVYNFDSVINFIEVVQMSILSGKVF
jgi:membrane associated rhomboid family serine protease